MEANRLESANEIVVPSIEQAGVQLAQQIKVMREAIRQHIDRHPDLRGKRDLLDSIPGIGESTITQKLTFMTGESFANAKQVASFLGLNPRQHQSGSSVRGKARLSKTGDSRLRMAFYMPAIVAMRYNPVIKSFSQRLLAAGKAMNREAIDRAALAVEAGHDRRIATQRAKLGRHSAPGSGDRCARRVRAELDD